MKIYYLLFTLTVFFSACKNPANKIEHAADSFDAVSQIQQMEWILGKWCTSSTDGDLYEVWKKENDSVFHGNSFMISNSDTVFSETIMLKNTADGLYYIPTVSDQNNNQPISFRLISDNYGTIVFENKDHDFPQRIVYSQPHPDSLHAYVEGEIQGKLRREDFRMAKAE